MASTYILIFLLLTGANQSCNTTHKSSEELRSCVELAEGNSGYIQLTDPDQSGEQLIIYGQVINSETGEPIENAQVSLYQADVSGNYNSTFFGMPSYAKIRGSLKTDSDGCFKVKTIVPGNYPGETDGKHIHVIANAGGYEKWSFEFLFEGWVSESLRKEVLKNKDAIILDLKEKEGNS